MTTPHDTQPFPPHGAPPPAASATPEKPARRRAGLASVVVVSLLVGGGAGLGGAALWDAVQPDETAPSPSSTRADASGSTDSGADATPTANLADGSVEQVASQVLPSVVKIDVTNGEESGSGSGIVLSEDGRILTNEHVVAVADDGGALRVSFGDGSTAEAEILGTDPLTDTAVIQASDVSGLTPATIGSSGELAVGQEVVAVGSPFGLESTVTSGIVSALDRPVNVAQQADGASTTYPAIQTDAAINPGNSGGPLVDTTGAVVGINSSIRTSAQASPFGEGSAGGSIGLGFAIPIDEVMPIVEQLSAGEEPTHAQLGIQVSDVDPSGDAAVSGAQVRELTGGSAAEAAGLASGDVITRIDGQIVTGADSLVATIRSYRPGDSVEVTFVRDGEEQTADLELDSDAE